MPTNDSVTSTKMIDRVVTTDSSAQQNNRQRMASSRNLCHENVRCREIGWLSRRDVPALATEQSPKVNGSIVTRRVNVGSMLWVTSQVLCQPIQRQQALRPLPTVRPFSDVFLRAFEQIPAWRPVVVMLPKCGISRIQRSQDASAFLC